MMRFNVEHVQMMYNRINQLKRVKTLNITQKDLADAMATINVINSLERGYTMVGDYLLSKYVIPSAVQELIIPMEIKVKDDIKLFDFKSDNYKQQDIVDGKILSPTDFETIWSVIFNSLRAKFDAASVEDARKPKNVQDIMDRLTDASGKNIAGDTICVPVLCKTNFYRDRYYAYDVEEVFEEWWTNVLLKAEK